MSLVVAKIYKKIEDKESDKLSKDAKKLAKDERYIDHVLICLTLENLKLRGNVTSLQSGSRGADHRSVTRNPAKFMEENRF